MACAWCVTNFIKILLSPLSFNHHFPYSLYALAQPYPVYSTSIPLQCVIVIVSSNFDSAALLLLISCTILSSSPLPASCLPSSAQPPPSSNLASPFPLLVSLPGLPIHLQLHPPLSQPSLPSLPFFLPISPPPTSLLFPSSSLVSPSFPYLSISALSP